MQSNYSHVNSRGKTYFLNSKQIVLRGDHHRVIYYFSKDKRPEGCDLPAGYEVTENPRNGFLTLKKVKRG